MTCNPNPLNDEATSSPFEPDFVFDRLAWRALRRSAALSLHTCVAGTDRDVVIMPIADAVDAFLGSAGISALLLWGQAGLRTIEVTTDKVIQAYSHSVDALKMVPENTRFQEGCAHVQPETAGCVGDATTFHMEGRQYIAFLDNSRYLSVVPSHDLRAPLKRIHIESQTVVGWNNYTYHNVSLFTTPDNKHIVVTTKDGWNLVDPSLDPSKAVLKTVPAKFFFSLSLPGNRLLIKPREFWLQPTIADVRTGRPLVNMEPVDASGHPTYVASTNRILWPVNLLCAETFDADTGAHRETIENFLETTDFVCQIHELTQCTGRDKYITFAIAQEDVPRISIVRMERLLDLQQSSAVARPKRERLGSIGIGGLQFPVGCRMVQARDTWRVWDLERGKSVEEMHEEMPPHAVP